MEATDSLIACLVALSIGLGTWSIGTMLSSLFIQWQKRLSTEAEFELENMFLQLPARSIFIYSLSIASFLGIFLFCSAIFLFSWSFISALIISTIVFLLCLFLPRLIIRIMKRRRLDRFNEQLEDALKAGFSIIQAIEVIIKQNRQPISIEFKLMLQSHGPRPFTEQYPKCSSSLISIDPLSDISLPSHWVSFFLSWY